MDHEIINPQNIRRSSSLAGYQYKKFIRKRFNSIKSYMKDSKIFESKTKHIQIFSNQERRRSSLKLLNKPSIMNSDGKNSNKKIKILRSKSIDPNNEKEVFF